MSARMVTEIVRIEFKVNLCPQTIQTKVKDGAVGFSPLRRGPKGVIPEHHFNNLCIAFETFTRVNQMNGNTRVLAPKRVGPLMHKVIYGTGDDNSNERFGVPSYSELLKRVLDATAMDLRKTKGHNAEDRRIRCTKNKIISMWFDHWENDLVELGTAVHDPISSKV
jgi:hypothetical protein